jgi:3-deoxy-D-manno-octulosonate 8-phosphate phosphatase (KDO 8-P phosphatase)
MARPVILTDDVRAGGRGFPPEEVYRGLKIAVFDVDGVLTDGRAYLDSQGQETKAFLVRDGAGIAFLRHAGLEVAILSGRRSAAVEARARELEIPPSRVWQDARHKAPAFEQLLAACAVRAGEVAYMGDDIVDLPVLERVGLACCPADAHPAALAACHVVATSPGGAGAVRQVCEHILGRRGPAVWAQVLRRYFRGEV